MSYAARAGLTIDVAAVLQAAATSALGIIALLCILLAALGYGLFKGSHDRYKFAAFALAFIGAGLLGSSLLHEGEKQLEKKDVPSPGTTAQPQEALTTQPTVS